MTITIYFKSDAHKPKEQRARQVIRPTVPMSADQCRGLAMEIAKGDYDSHTVSGTNKDTKEKIVPSNQINRALVEAAHGVTQEAKNEAGIKTKVRRKVYNNA